MYNAFFNVYEKLSSSISNHSEELATSKTVVANRYTTVPDTDDHHDVSDVHLLQHGQEFVTGSVFTIIIKALSENFLLLDWVHLAYSVS